MMPLFIVVIFTILFFSGCDSDSDSQYMTGHNEIDTIKLWDFDKEYHYSDVFSNLSYLPLTGLPEDSPIGVVYKLIYSQDHIFILDTNTQSVFIFDGGGHFIRRIQSIGAGPGEYIDITDLAYNDVEKEICILDRSRFLLKYALTGEFIDEINLPKKATQVASTPKGNLIFYSIPKVDPSSDKHATCSLWKLLNDNSSDCLDTRRGTLMPNISAETNMFSKYDSTLFFTYTGSQVIYTIDNNILFPKFIFDFGDQPVRKIYDPFSMDWVKYREYVRRNPDHVFPMAELHHNNNVVISQVFTNKPTYFYYFYKDGKLIHGRTAKNDIDGVDVPFLIFDLYENSVIGKLYQGNFIDHIQNLPETSELYQKYKNYTWNDPPMLIKLDLKN